MPELRQDLISGDWVLLAPGRAARPKFLDQKRKPRKPGPKAKCPFENLESSGNWPPVLTYPNEERWKMAVIPNKYPAIGPGEECSVPFAHDIYTARTAVGTHRLLITRDHNRHFADLSPREAARLFGILQSLHRDAAKDKCAAYTSSFYNYGPEAGASVWHPHYQIITLPIVPPHEAHSLRGANDYFKTHRRCVRCDMIALERKKKSRVVLETEHAIAIMPYASKRPFEVSVLPKKHWDSLRDTPAAALDGIAITLHSVLLRIRKHLNDPDLNFFIHDAPFGHGDHRHHHWHIEVVPRITFDAGFEFSTGIEINVVDPDQAAGILRGQRS